MAIDHYMVDFADDAGDVQYAHDLPIYSLSAAKALASKTSKERGTGAYVVAFVRSDAVPGKFVPCGHISFFEGRQDATDGIVI